MASVPRQKIPPLENGDRLSRDEFERRYDAMPGLKKAELIDEVVYMPSPVRADQHGAPHFDRIGWMSYYRWSTPGVIGADNASIGLDLANMPQPDACLFIDPARGGQSQITGDGYIEDAPELVAEVAASSVSYDLGPKLDVYRRHEVREYLVWRVLDRQIDWFAMRQRRFVRLPLDRSGVYRSMVFHDLWLEPAALIRGDTATLHAVLQRGLATREHAAFVKQLSERHTP